MKQARVQQAYEELLRRRAQERSAPGVPLEQVRALAELRSIPDDQRALLDQVLSHPVSRAEYYDLREVAQGGAAALPGWLPAWALAAVVILIAIGFSVVVFSQWRGPHPEPLPVGAAEVILVSPATNEEFSHETRFVWRSLNGATDYVLQLLNEDGEMVWNQTSTDTTLVLPAGAPVIGGMKYSWLVRANLKDGTTANSSAHAIRARE